MTNLNIHDSFLQYVDRLIEKSELMIRLSEHNQELPDKEKLTYRDLEKEFTKRGYGFYS